MQNDDGGGGVGAFPRITSAAPSLDRRALQTGSAVIAGKSALTAHKEPELLCKFTLFPPPPRFSFSFAPTSSYLNCSNITPSSSASNTHRHTAADCGISTSKCDGRRHIISGRRQRRGRMKSFRQRRGGGITTPVGMRGAATGRRRGKDKRDDGRGEEEGREGTNDGRRKKSTRAEGKNDKRREGKTNKRRRVDT